jgi:hypothetical protein
MGIGTGIVSFVTGAILYWAVDTDLPFVLDDALGVILMAAGLITVVAAVVTNVQSSQVGAGTGIGLVVTGALLYWAVDVNLPFVADGALGMILMVAGMIAVVAAVIMNVQRSRTGQVADYR